MIKRMCLESHERTICEHLSGGNKRKLSTALALIGEPDVVLLDEPSTGVDVGARRFLWDVIGGIRKSGHALVLTSHSMEECEVLCTRLTIMVAGQFRCLGSPTQLKGKYGGGYTLTIKALLSNDNDACARIREFVGKNLPEATLAEESVGLFRYGLHSDVKNSQEIPLADIFAKLELATKTGGDLNGCVSDYTISQTSLEEVFLHFAQDTAASTTLTNGTKVDGNHIVEPPKIEDHIVSPPPINPAPLNASKIAGDENWPVGVEELNLSNELHEEPHTPVQERLVSM
jgi:ABC-type multidrug transport system ATPase subunit